MTVSSQTNKIIYIGNGVAKEFAIPFSFLEKEHLKVRQKKNDIQTERTDWTVKNGNLVFAIAPASGAEIAIVREVPLTQETDYRDNEILHAETLERCFDKLTMQVQQLAEKSNRAVKVSMFSDTDPSALANEVEVLYGIRDKIETVAQNKADINTIAAHISDVSTAVANIAAIQDVPMQAINAVTNATNAAVWAEGTDAQVQALGGTHSSKVWAEQSSNANVDLSNLSQTGKARFQTLLVSGTNIRTVNSEPLLGSGDIELVKKDFSNALKPYIDLSYQNGDSGYIKLSNGFTVQWGNINPISGQNTVNFLTPFTVRPAVSFIRFSGYTGTASNISYWSNIASSRNLSNFTFYADGQNQTYVSWMAFGF